MRKWSSGSSRRRSNPGRRRHESPREGVSEVPKRKAGEAEAAPANPEAVRSAPRVLKVAPAAEFGVDPSITRNGKARLVDRGAGGVCVEYTLSDEALLEAWRQYGPPGHAEWPLRKPFSPEPDRQRMERAMLRALAARKMPPAA